MRVLARRILVLFNLYAREEYQHFEYPVRRPVPQECAWTPVLSVYLANQMDDRQKLEMESHMNQCWCCQIQYAACISILSRERQVRWPDEGVRFPLLHRLRASFIGRLLRGQPYYVTNGQAGDDDPVSGGPQSGKGADGYLGVGAGQIATPPTSAWEPSSVIPSRMGGMGHLGEHRTQVPPPNDNTPFAQFYRRECQALYRYVYAWVGDHDDALELMQESFGDIYQLGSGYDRAALYRMARNRVQALPEEKRRCAVFDRLASQDQECLALRLAGLRYPAVAEIMNIDPSSVSKVANSAIRKFEEFHNSPAGGRRRLTAIGRLKRFDLIRGAYQHLAGGMKRRGKGDASRGSPCP